MSLSIQLNQIEINNNSMNDICAALLVLIKTELTDANHYRLMLTPLAELMGELIDQNSNALLAIDKLGKTA